jgi:hypothetical protein
MDHREFATLVKDFKDYHDWAGGKFKELEDAYSQLDNEKDDLENELNQANGEIESLKARLFDLGESANA